MNRRGGDPKAVQGAMTEETGSQSPAKKPPRRVFRLVSFALVIAIFILGSGFVWFVERLPQGEPVLERDADGIVVLTGRASRISDAIELLASKRGQRLLITGVYPTTTAAALARLAPEHQHLFICCVTLDHDAVNTSGNAVQTRKWARSHNIKSLIVVTSNYHMPRTLTEIAHELPDVELIPYAIPPERVRIENWWSNFATARLLFAEYLKYLRARARTQITLGSAGTFDV